MPDGQHGANGLPDGLPADATRLIPVVRVDPDATQVTPRPTAPPRAPSATPAAAPPAQPTVGARPAPTAQSRPAATPPPAPPRTTSIVRRVMMAIALILVLLLAYVGVLAGLVITRMDRVDAAPNDQRPSDGPGHTFLLVGSDSREGLSDDEKGDLSTGSAAGKRTDTILMLHASEDGSAVLVSIPRDSYVPIPGHGSNKINAAYALGGAPLLVQTLEDVTGVRIDDYIEVGFGGFVAIVDAVGGVEVCLEGPLQDDKANIDLPAGCQVLDGTDALGFVRARYSDPRGDLGRVERQQQFLQALAQRAISPAVWANPLRATRTAMAAGDALTVGEEVNVVDLGRFGIAMLKVSGSNGATLTVPVADTPTLPGVGSVVRWDREEALALFNAIADDTPIPPEILESS